jgi:hypothetical protein
MNLSRAAGPLASHFEPHKNGENSKTPYRQVLVAPGGSDAGRYFANVAPASSFWRDVVDDLQRFRGSFYYADGALRKSDLTSDGRHHQAIDLKSWHLLSLDANNNIMSCARYFVPENATFESTSASRSSLAASPIWRAKLKIAIDGAIQSARQRGMTFAELGGWCVSINCRNSREVLRTVLSMFALGKILGGTLALSTATKRHASAEILRRLGGFPLQAEGSALPAYFEPLYRCEMELLTFDSSFPAPKYAHQVSAYCAQMQDSLEVLQMAENPASASESLFSLANKLEKLRQPDDCYALLHGTR